MTTRTVRVTVRGAFDGLSTEQPAALRQPEHDSRHATFTRAGNRTSDIPVGARGRRTAR